MTGGEDGKVREKEVEEEEGPSQASEKRAGYPWVL